MVLIGDDETGGDPLYDRSMLVMNRKFSLVFGLLMIWVLSLHGWSEQCDLAGSWQFKLDPGGENEPLKLIEGPLTDTVTLPGTPTAQGYGSLPGMDTQWTGDLRQEWFDDPYYKQYQTPNNFKMPFWLQPDRHYVGRAWYRRTITIPPAWQGKRVVLFLERPHWRTVVWLDGKLIGSKMRLAAPHEYDLGCGLDPGEHQLTVAVDNTMIVDVGRNSHSVSDHTQGNWNGIAGRIELRVTDPVWLDDVRVYPSFSKHQLRVNVTVDNQSGRAVMAGLTFAVSPQVRQTAKLRCDSGRTEHQVMIPLTDQFSGWDEFNPQLYTLTVGLDSPAGSDRRQVSFGLRDLTTRGTQFVLNGTPIYFRGTLECCIFPLTGYPPTDVKAWERIIRICKAHGLNHIRFHSWCPPEAAFTAADRCGFYFQVECSSWANQSTALGDGRPVDQWIYDEADAILKAYGNHPSFMLMAYGNEPGGKKHAAWLMDFVRHYQQVDPRRLYTTGSGWPIKPGSDYHSSPEPRIQRWGEGLGSRINSQAPRSDYGWGEFVARHNDAPVISHEIGQWCVYPNLDERAKYTGLLKAKNFDIFEEQLRRHGMLDQAKDFLMASGKLQALCYKADIEAALRTEGFGGFQLLDLHDFPGQGTALVGVLDPFWDSKGYISAKAYARFCGPIVPLALLPRHIYEDGDQLAAVIKLSHFGPADLNGLVPVWTLTDSSGKRVAQGEFPAQDLPRGGLYRLGTVITHLRADPAARQLKLTVSAKGQTWSNDWDIWVYPRAKTVERVDSDIYMTSVLDEQARRRLDRGGRVLWLPEPSMIQGDPKRGKVEMGFSSIFWNTVWTGFQPPHTLGILCDPQAAALAEFPTEYHSNWQWWDLVHDRVPFILTGQPIRPTVQIVDDWVTARKLALIFEARVGAGKLLACAADISHDLANRPVARQLRTSLLHYMAGGAFKPSARMSWETAVSLCRQPSVLEKLGAQASSDSQQTGYEAALAIDGNPKTIWHTAWSPASPMPHELIITFKRTAALKGITCQPRQDMSNGRIGRYEIYVSRDGKKWNGPVARGSWPDNGALQEVHFDQTCSARAIKLKVLSSANNQPYASAAEIGLIME